MPKSTTSYGSVSNVNTHTKSHILCANALNRQIDGIVNFIKDGISKNQTNVIIANPDTIIMINKKLRQSDVELIKLMNAKKFITYDAEDLLKKLKINEQINHQQLYDFIHDIIHRESSSSTIRFYCELVDNLLNQENYKEALKLENFLNTLLKYHKLLLYCSYPHMHESKGNNSKVTELIRCHNQVVA